MKLKQEKGDISEAPNGGRNNKLKNNLNKQKMKKLVLFFAIMFAAAGLHAQKAVMANYTDTIVDADIHYYMVLAPLTKNYAYTLQFYIDHLTGSSDSTHIEFQGSIDGTTYYKIDPGTPTVDGGATWITPDKYARIGTTDGSVMYFPTTYVSFPYLRAKVQHYATGTVRVKGWVYLKQR